MDTPAACAHCEVCPGAPVLDSEPELSSSPPRSRPTVRWPVMLRRMLVLGHTAVTTWLLFTRQVTLGIDWLGPLVAATCTLSAAFIAATAIRGKYWPWVWALAGWIAPAGAYWTDSMWPIYWAVLVLPALGLWIAQRTGTPLEVHLWLFRDFHPAEVVHQALHHETHYTLYRHFDATGRLLYVGKTNRPAWKRSNEHAKEKNWWGQVTTTTYTRYLNETDLAREEVVAIRRERPLHNVQHNRR